MSNYIQNIRLKNRSFSEGNKHDSLKESMIKKQLKERAILKEIFERKIRVNGNLISIKDFLQIDNSKSCQKSNKITDLYDNYEEKILFNEWLIANKDKHKFIESEILKLLIQIFDKRYKIYPNNICAFSPFATLCKKNIEIFCQKYNELSIYVLYVLNNQFIPLFKYINEKINFKSISPNIYENIKDIVHYIGNDIQKIFKIAIDNINAENFDFSNIITILLEDYLIKNKLKEPKKIKNILLYKEKEKFEKYVKTIYNMKFLKDYGICINPNIYIGKENEQNNINKNENNSNIYRVDNLKAKVSKNCELNNNICSTQNLTIDDLMNYINEPNAKNNKKKKKKKKKGKKNAVNDEKTDDLNEDIVIIDYKKSLEEFSQNLSDTHKIKPKYSEKFLAFLALINN